MENKKLNGFNNGRDTTEGVGGKTPETLDFTPSIEQITKTITIHKLDNVTVSIYNGHFNFSYTIADSVVKDELKGKFRYIGGLQSNFENDSENHKLLEEKLCILAEKILK